MWKGDHRLILSAVRAAVSRVSGRALCTAASSTPAPDRPKSRRRPTFQSNPNVLEEIPVLMYGEIPTEQLTEELLQEEWITQQEPAPGERVLNPLLGMEFYAKDDSTDAESLRLVQDDPNAEPQPVPLDEIPVDPESEDCRFTASLTAHLERMGAYDHAEVESVLEVDEAQTENLLYRRVIDAVADVAAVRKRRQEFFKRIAERANTPQRREARRARRAEARDQMRRHDYVGVSNLVPKLTPENTPLLSEEIRAQLQPQLEMYARGIGLNPSWSMPQKQKFMRMLVRFFNEDPNGRYAQDVQDGMFFMPKEQMREITPAHVREIIERRKKAAK